MNGDFSYTVDQQNVVILCNEIYPISNNLQAFSDDITTYLNNLNCTRGYDRLGKNILPDFAPVGDEYAGLLVAEGNKIYQMAGIAHTFDSTIIDNDISGDGKKGLFGWDWETIGATGAMFGLNLIEGALTGGETFIDGFLTLGTYATDLFGWDAGTQWLTDRIENDAVGQFFDNQYENGALQWVNEHSMYKYDSTGAAVVKGIGTAASYIALTALTGKVGGAVVGKIGGALGHTAVGTGIASATTAASNIVNKIPVVGKVAGAVGKYVAPGLVEAGVTYAGTLGFATGNALRDGASIQDARAYGQGVAVTAAAADLAIEGAVNAAPDIVKAIGKYGDNIADAGKAGDNIVDAVGAKPPAGIDRTPELPATGTVNTAGDVIDTATPATGTVNAAGDAIDTATPATGGSQIDNAVDAGDGYKVTETTNARGNPETTVKYPDGTVEVTEIYPDGSTNTTLSRADGKYDIPSTLDESRKTGDLVHEGRVKQNGDGSTTWNNEYSDGTTETWTKNSDGSTEVTRKYSDGSTETWHKGADGNQVTETFDATTNKHSARVENPDGSIEVTNIDPDGTTSTIKYTRGSQADNIIDVAKQTDNVIDAAKQTDNVIDAAKQTDNVIDAAKQTDNVIDAAKQADNAADAAKPGFGTKLKNVAKEVIVEGPLHPGRTGAAIHNHMHDPNHSGTELPPEEEIITGTEPQEVPTCPKCHLPATQCNCPTGQDTTGGSTGGNSSSDWPIGGGGGGGGYTGGGSDYETPTYPEYETPTYPEYEMPTYPEYETPTYPDGTDGNNGNDGDDGSSYPWGDNGWGGGNSGPGASDFIDDLGNSSEDTKVSIEDALEDATASLDEIIDMTTGVNIPTSANPIKSTINTKDNNMVPLMAGLGAAALAGLGTKAYLDHKENKDNEEEIEAEEWEEDLSESENLGLQESDYLMPTDEFAYQPEGMNMSIEDEGERYQAVNSSELPSIN